MTTTYDWHTTYRNAVEAFAGNTPGAQLEQELLDTFQHSPQTVTQAISKAAHAYHAGRVTSPWGIVRSELHRISNQPHLEITDDRARNQAIAKAEAWIRHTGLHLDHDELITNLFTPAATTPDLAFLEQLERDTRDRPGRPLYNGLLQAAIRKTREQGPQPINDTAGPLTAYDNPVLRQRMTALWQEVRPHGLTLEQEAAERADTWKHQQAAQQTALKQAKLELANAAEREPAHTAAPTDDNLPL